jgi:hypothetical protein
MFFDVLMKARAGVSTAQEYLEKEIKRTYEDSENDQARLWVMYTDFVQYLQEKGRRFKDVLYPPNISSLVNNPRKCTLAWKNSDWTRLNEEIFPKCCFLEKFDPEVILFNGHGITENLEHVLSALCEWPERIKKMFLTEEANWEGAYLGRVFQKGWWKPVLIDDMVPTDENVIPISCNGQIDKDKKVELWPHLVSKMLAKHYVNYERQSHQNIGEFMKDLTGMPTKTHKVRRLDPEQLRYSFTKNYVMIAKSNAEFVKKYMPNATKPKHTHCNLVHVFQLEDKSLIFEFKQYGAKVEKNTNFHISTKIQIEVDWKKVRGYSKVDTNTFWVTWEELQQYFSTVWICYYDEAMDYDFRKFMLKDANKFAVNIQVTGAKTRLHIEVDQLDKLFCASGENYSDVRVFVIKRDYYKGSDQTISTLVRATMSSKTRTTMIDGELSQGSYTIVAECTFADYQHDYVLSVYYPRGVDLQLEEENALVRKRAYLDMICGTAIQNGTKDYLTENQNVRRYSFWSEKLNLFVYVFTNNSRDKFCIAEKLKITGEYECNIDVKNNYMKLYLPALSKKAVIFKFKSSQFNKIEVEEHTMQVTS